MDASDNQLIDQYLNGQNEDAFEQLIRRHSPMVWGVCRSLLWQSQDAEDAYQAIFILLATQAPKLRDHKSVGGWLHETSVRTCLKLRRQITRIREVKMEYDPAISNSEPWQIITSDRDRELLHREIMHLPDRYREFIVLCLLEGKSRGQAAAINRCPTTVVKAALAQGRKLLRRRLLKHGIGMAAVLGLVGSTSSANAASATTIPQLLEPLIESTLQACLSRAPLASHSLPPGIQSLVQNRVLPLGSSFSSTALAVVATALVVGSLLSALCWFAPQSTTETKIVEIVPPLRIVEAYTTVSLEFELPENLTVPNSNPNDVALQQEEGQDYREALEAALNKELVLMKELVGLDSTTLDNLKAAVKQDLEQAVERCLERDLNREGPPGIIFIHPVLEEGFENAIWQKGNDLIPKSKRADFAKFVSGAKKRNAIDNGNCQESVAQYLTNLLSLSSDQKQQIKAMLAKKWDREWNVPARLIGVNRPDLGGQVFYAMEVDSILNEKQLNYFRAVENLTQLPSSNGLLADDRTRTGMELKNRCSTLMDLKTDEINRIFDLTPSQQTRLEIAKKGVISKVVSLWEEGDRIQENRSALICLTQQCTSQEMWQKAIRDTLDPEDLQRWETRERARTRANRDVLIDKTVDTLTMDISLSWEQRSKLVKLLEQHLEPVGMSSVADATVRLTTVPEQEIENVLFDSQLATVLTAIQNRRKWAKEYFSLPPMAPDDEQDNLLSTLSR